MLSELVSWLTLSDLAQQPCQSVKPAWLPLYFPQFTSSKLPISSSGKQNAFARMLRIRAFSGRMKKRWGTNQAIVFIGSISSITSSIPFASNASLSWMLPESKGNWVGRGALGLRSRRLGSVTAVSTGVYPQSRSLSLRKPAWRINMAVIRFLVKVEWWQMAGSACLILSCF